MLKMTRKQHSKKGNNKIISKSTWDREISAIIRRNEQKYYCNKCEKTHETDSESWKMDAGHADIMKSEKYKKK